MQFIDLKAQYEVLKDQIDVAIGEVLEHGQFINGPEVAELENKLARYVGAKHCIACGNGTDALQMLFMAYGIGMGDVVFCPDVTFVASVEPAVMLGARPVFCDIAVDSYNLCPNSLERQIKAVLEEGRFKPKAVIAVDFLGNPADYDTLSAVCERYNLILIEDAAQSFGASFRGKQCGSFGAAATTSFFPAKPLGCYGDGGAIFTDDDELAVRLGSIRVHGKGPGGKYDNICVGVNSRLDTLQAAILLKKLMVLPNEIEARQRVVARYNRAFGSYFIIPHIALESISVYAQYALLANDVNHRNAVITHLKNKCIPNMVYYPIPQHQLPVFQKFNQYGETFTISERYCACTFSLPMHPYLGESDQDEVIAKVLECV